MTRLRLLKYVRYLKATVENESLLRGGILYGTVEYQPIGSRTNKSMRRKNVSDAHSLELQKLGSNACGCLHHPSPQTKG